MFRLQWLRLWALAASSTLVMAGCQPSSQADAWSQARIALPADAAVYRPNFGPDRFGPPILLEARNDEQSGPRCTVEYSAGDEHLVLSLGVPSGAFGNAARLHAREPISVHGFDGNLVSSSTSSPAYGVNWAGEEPKL